MNRATTLYGLCRVQQQVLKDTTQQVAVADDRWRGALDGDIQIGEGRVLTKQGCGVREQCRHVERRRPDARRPSEEQQIAHEVVQRIKPRDDFRHDSGIVVGETAADHLDCAAHGRQGVPDFVGQDRGHLAQPGERRPFAQLRLG